MSKNTHASFLKHWSFDSINAKDEGNRNISDPEEHENETSDFVGNSAGARSFLRLQRSLNTEGHSIDGYDDSSCTGMRNGRLCEACSSRKLGIPEIPYFQITSKSQLLYGSEEPEEEEEEDTDCANIHSNDQSLWAEDPNFYRGMTADGMGFLSQVAHVCRFSKLSVCHKSSCKKRRERMEGLFPEAEAWPAFKSWALTAMSCQQHHRQCWTINPIYHAAHTHIASAVATLAMTLAECSRPCHRDTIFRSQLDTTDEYEQEDNGSEDVLNSVWNVLYWMISVQYNYSVGPDKFGRWGSDMLSSGLDNSFILQSTLDASEETNVCKYRLWNLLDEGDRGDADLLPIVSYLVHYKEYMEKMSVDDHKECTPGFCQKGIIDSTKTEQMHFPDEGHACSILEFDMSKVDEAVDAGRNTAWSCYLEDGQPQINLDGDYVALSHVWSDGTGVGIGERNNNTCQVNHCLWTFWQEMITQIPGQVPDHGSPAIWWDTISIPQNKKKRELAIKSLHRNYSKAKCTIVHDKNLANVDFPNNGVRCVALVLSNWFSRGWTALELQMSEKVLVIFKEGDTHKPIPLDDLLAKSPSMASPAHWLATKIIKRMKDHVDDVGDIIHILKPRYTSWPRDMTTIAALLADVPDLDPKKDTGLLTRDILIYLGKIPSLSLLHGEATMTSSGGWSWCPSTLLSMPGSPSIDVESRKISDFLSMLDVTEGGAVHGVWRRRWLNDEDSKTIRVFGRDSSSRIKVRIALQGWDKCALLRPRSTLEQKEPALLVKVLGRANNQKNSPLACEYISAVWEIRALAEADWDKENIVIGLDKAEDVTEEVRDPSEKSSSPSSEPEEVGDEDGASVAAMKAEAKTWLEKAVLLDDWPESEGSSQGLDQAITMEEDGISQDDLILSIVEGCRDSTSYLLERGLQGEHDIESDVIQGLESYDYENRSNVIDGLWSLGDHCLKDEDFTNARKAYAAAYNLATKAADNQDEDSSGRINILLRYQYAMVSMLAGDRETAETQFLIVTKSHSKTTTSPSNFQRTFNVRSKQGYQDEGEDKQYYAKRGAFGALILLSLEPDPQGTEHDQPLDGADKYFWDSLRFEDRASLLERNPRLHPQSSIDPGSLRNASEQLVAFCLREGEENRPECTFDELRVIYQVLKGVLKKFDRVFRKKHILCCISALCLGVVLKIAMDTYDKQWNDGERFRDESIGRMNDLFNRVKDDMEEILPPAPEDNGHSWVLKKTLLSHCIQVPDKRTEVEAEAEAVAEDGEEEEGDGED